MRTTWIALATFVIGSMTLPAFAGEAYVGASYLSADLELDTSLNNWNASSDGYKAFAGYQFTPNFALELAYYDLGDFDDVQGLTTFRASGDAFDFGARGIIPLGKWFDLFGRVGFSDLSFETATTTGIGTVSTDSSTWELSYAAGVAFKIGNNFGLRAEWEAWDVEDSLQAWSVGAYFRFGKR